jgi:radical SAM superfamily enzyme YgiQ (UPF0313 family)
MELSARKGEDRFVPSGAYRALEARLRAHRPALEEIRAVVLAALDRRTRMLPFILYDAHMFPAGACLVAAALAGAGFRRTRAVYELWNPGFRPSRARLEGRRIQMLLVSSMKINAARAYAAVADAWSMGAERPLIIAGGPKAIYEPYDFWVRPDGRPRSAPDVAVTGEAYVLLELLDVLLQHRGRGDTMRAAFERARLAGALEGIPGLVFLAPGASHAEPVLVDTGLQRLVADLDELPSEAAGLGLLEPPHRGRGLAAQPIPATRVGRFAKFVNVLMTQGCKFHCAYCPIPAVQQHSWRHRSPDGVVEVMRSVVERHGVKYFFGVDDNFFNRRETAEAMLGAMARATAWGRPFGERVQFGTEATQFDTYRNRDLLPLARAAGMMAIWFGIEDLTASLINKGQKPGTALELFRLMEEQKIAPMVMLMAHQEQPFSTPGSLYGLADQVRFLRRAGAVTLQCFVHTPAVGTREYEGLYDAGGVIARAGRYPLPERMIDANHVVVGAAAGAWKRQLQLVAAYATFYNPWNLLQTWRTDRSRLRRRRLGFQLAGMIATALTGMKLFPYVLRLLRGRVEYHRHPPAVPVRVRHPARAFRRYPNAAPAASLCSPRRAPEPNPAPVVPA